MTPDGQLYQPAAWEELRPNPDPALVVEWRDLPGEYYAPTQAS